jgi:hypothetical protein
MLISLFLHFIIHCHSDDLPKHYCEVFSRFLRFHLKSVNFSVFSTINCDRYFSERLPPVEHVAAAPFKNLASGSPVRNGTNG